MLLAPAGSLRFDLPIDLAALAEVAAAVERLSAAAGWPSATAFAVQLCLEEAISNVIRHGDVPAGETVAVTLHHDAASIAVEISDRGRAFDPLAAPPPAPLVDLATAGPGGRGIGLMRRFCPAISYRRTNGANHLRLAFALEPPVG